MDVDGGGLGAGGRCCHVGFMVGCSFWCAAKNSGRACQRSPTGLGEAWSISGVYPADAGMEGGHNPTAARMSELRYSIHPVEWALYFLCTRLSRARSLREARSPWRERRALRCLSLTLAHLC